MTDSTEDQRDNRNASSSKWLNQHPGTYAAHQAMEHMWRQCACSVAFSDEGHYMADNVGGHSENGHYEDGRCKSRGHEFRGSYPVQLMNQQTTTGWMQQLDRRPDV